MKEFRLCISSPDGNLFEGTAVAVYLRGTEGDLAILAGHIPFVTGISKGEIRIELPDGTEKRATCDGGLLSVSEDSVTVLSASARF